MKRYEVTPLPGYDLVIGRWLWAMQQTRKRTLRLVKDLDEDLLDGGGGAGWSGERNRNPSSTTSPVSKCDCSGGS